MKIYIKAGISNLHRLAGTLAGAVQFGQYLQSPIPALERNDLRFTHTRGWIVFFLLMLCPVFCLSQNLSAVIAKADTSGFRPYNNGGWILYNSYIARGQDGSVTFEVILQHNKTGINWSNEQYFGKIKNQNFLPLSDKIISYDYPGFGDNYTIRISDDGKCYLNLADGSLPPEDPVVIYVRVKY
ncbi:MAG TPA: hypothetical protein VFI29_14945 [Hanamia sp.]|nr:hypothetical protein [Hanamia sp.]